MKIARLRPLVFIAVLALVAGACAQSKKVASAGPVAVSLSDFKITPSRSAPAGKPFTIAVRNDGKVTHSLALEAAGMTMQTAVLQPGASADLPVEHALGPGGYKLWCTVPGHKAAGMEAVLTVAGTAGSPVAQASMTAEQMDAEMEAGVKAFPAKTAGVGGAVLKPLIRNGAKEFDLAVKAVKWEVTPGQFVDAFAFNGIVPGPELHVSRGDKVRVVVHNELSESTVVHFHGITLPNAMDGVPYITQPPIKTGKTFTYEFTIVDSPGTYMYHSHHNAAIQVGRGLYGALVVDPPSRSWNVARTMFLSDGPMGYTLDGKGFPATAPIVAKRGQKVLVRFLNAGQMLHPMHLHGFHFTVVSRDGRPIAPYVVDTLVIAPGERYDVIVNAIYPGVWAFHCHILDHVESEHGMFGMVTVLIVA